MFFLEKTWLMTFHGFWKYQAAPYWTFCYRLQKKLEFYLSRSFEAECPFDFDGFLLFSRKLSFLGIGTCYMMPTHFPSSIYTWNNKKKVRKKGTLKKTSANVPFSWNLSFLIFIRIISNLKNFEVFNEDVYTFAI